MPGPYILALDEGTSSARSIVFDRAGRTVGSAQQEFTQHFPHAGWVEHDAEEIWRVQLQTARAALRKARVKPQQVAGIGITNQRETVVVWNARTGRPVHRAIVWQDRRTAAHCAALRARGLERTIAQRTGLVLDPYFSATKLAWILDHVRGAHALAQRGQLLAGTIDTWLAWKLSGGAAHVTDPSNASRTMLFNLRTGDWDDSLLKRFGIPRAMLPRVVPSSGVCGVAARKHLGAEIPIGGLIGDQQAALFGQLCHRSGMAKCTYGTGCFLLMNTGTRIVRSRNRLLTTVAWKLGRAPTQFALEGSVFVGGAAIQWLRDGLGIIARSKDVNALASSVSDSGGAVLVPAFAGLGTPYWDASARGALLGITRGTTRAHVARATLEGIAFQVEDLISAMQRDVRRGPRELRVDGGAAASDVLMQMQADILGAPVVRLGMLESTAFGAAAMAGLATGVWKNCAAVPAPPGAQRTFKGRLRVRQRAARMRQWHTAVERCRGWEKGS